jgi:hypothetical protein
VTHVTLINEDIDFEVKESVMETLRLVTGEDYETKPTNTRRPFRTSDIHPGRKQSDRGETSNSVSV